MENNTLSMLINTLSHSMWKCSVLSDKMEVLWSNSEDICDYVAEESLSLFTKDGISCSFPINSECYGILKTAGKTAAITITPVYESGSDTQPCGYITKEINPGELFGGSLVSGRSIASSRRFANDITANISVLRSILESKEMYSECSYTGNALSSCSKLMGSIANSIQLEKILSGSGKKILSDASAFVKMIGEICSFNLGSKAEISLDVQPDILMYMDYDKFSSAMVNLIINAYQYNLSDEKRISVTFAAQDGNAVLTVDDNGEGMPEQPTGVPRDFENMLEDMVSREGLGLTVVKLFADSCGGDLQIISKGYGKGTTVRLSIPIDETTDGFLRSSAADYIENKFSTIYITLSKAEA